MRLKYSIALVVFVMVLLLAYFALRNNKPEEKGNVAGVDRVLSGDPAAGFARALTPRSFSFPKDHGPHPGYRTEWWYYTGNLQSHEGRRFGYQLTIFRVALTPQKPLRTSPWAANEIFMAHFAVTDVQGKRFHYAERFSRAALGLAGAGGRPLTVNLENWSAREISTQPWSVKLSAADADMAIDLDLKSLSREILNGDRGLSRKGGKPGNASYYYSIPRMATSGSIRVGKESFRVTGLSWLDREWSTSALEPDQVGWDWFALQLDDGRDLMFYRLRRRDGSADPFSSGTLVAADGSVKLLPLDQVQLEVVSWWTSPKSGGRYPAVWRMRIPSQGIALEITPRLADQELSGRFRYWEGAVAVQGLSGTPGGTGYVELTGYAGREGEKKQ
jgi:predicted secreted hydrolase